MAARIANLILWLTGPLSAYLSKLLLARLEALFDETAPITWRDLSPFSPVRPAEVSRHEP